MNGQLGLQGKNPNRAVLHLLRQVFMNFIVSKHFSTLGFIFLIAFIVFSISFIIILFRRFIFLVS